MVEDMFTPDGERVIVADDGIYARIREWEPGDLARFDQMRAEVSRQERRILLTSWGLVVVAVFNLVLLSLGGKDWFAPLVYGLLIGMSMGYFGIVQERYRSMKG